MKALVVVTLIVASLAGVALAGEVDTETVQVVSLAAALESQSQSQTEDAALSEEEEDELDLDEDLEEEEADEDMEDEEEELDQDELDEEELAAVELDESALDQSEDAEESESESEDAAEQELEYFEAIQRNEMAQDESPMPPPTPAAAAATTPAKPPTTPVAYVNGVDISVEKSQDVFECLRSKAYKGKLSRVVPLQAKTGTGPDYTKALQTQIAQTDFTKVILRTPMLGGKTVVQSIKNARKAGYPPADIGVYFINFRASEKPEATVARMLKSLTEVKSEFGTLWLDVEGKRGPPMWVEDSKKNCAYFTRVVQLLKEGQTKKTIPAWKLGIYTGMSRWGVLMGATCNFDAFKSLPIWYAAYGSSRNTFDSWKPMKNAWPEAHGHQWHGTTKFCGTVVDFNIFKSNAY